MNQFTRWLPDVVSRRALFWREFVQHRTAKVHPRPVLIGGSQKSGTTAIGALLAKATGVRYSYDPFWRALQYDSQAYQLVEILENRLTLETFIDRHPAYFAAEIVKCPDFAFLYPRLRSRFPDAQYVFIVRDPRQNIRSILNRLRIPGNLERLGPEAHRMVADKPGWRGVLSGAGLGITEGNYVSRLAQRWNLGVQGYLDQRPRIHLVRYEDFMADKTGSIRELATALGLAVVSDIGADLDRQYQPAGNRSVALDTFFGEKNLETIESICAPGMAMFGYARNDPGSSARSGTCH
jgi:hypothetical protein